MTVISGYVQLMAECDDSTQRLEFSEQILRQFDALTNMQREVLEFARGEKTVFIRKVYLKRFFTEIRRQLAQEIGERPIELNMNVDSKGVARFDEGRISRAIFNLARNAVEAMQSRGGALSISARLENQELVIVVADTGPGIPKEIEDRMFQSFVTAGKQGGTGLGLAIVKKIVEEHGGQVLVSSTDEGARFELRLPQPGPKDAPDSTRDTRETKSASQPSEGEKARTKSRA